MENKWVWLQPICEEIYKTKYGLRGEGIEQAFREIAQVVSQAEIPSKRKKWEEKFFNLMMSGRFIPAGRILANARLESKIKNYSNCFTIDIGDSMDSIYTALKEDAVISKQGGGIGFDISKLRPEGDKLSVGGVSSGPISFVRIFDASAKVILTGGARRSAHICLMDVSHPDIEKFITAKQGDRNGALTSFNISVKITDKFMEAVEQDADWNLEFGGKVYKTVKAKYLFELLTKNAYINNEPGVFFSDTTEKYNNAWWKLKLDRVNPCGELVMPAYAQCTLSHVYLPAYVKNPFATEASFDFKSFKEDIPTMTRFLDNIIDIQDYPLDKIKKMSFNWRRIGLGFTGLADTFVKMKMTYGNKTSKELCDKIGETLRNASYMTSVELAIEKKPFKECNKRLLLQSKFIRKLPKEIRTGIKRKGLRNIGLNTCAPCGTNSLSIGQNCSSGIEPIFARQYFRNIKVGMGDETIKEIVYNRAWLEYINLQRSKTPDIKEDDIKVPEYFKATVEDGTINIQNEMEIQAILQNYIDHSISKTFNLPKGTTFDEYQKIFVTAYKLGLKGFTSFNSEGSMKGILEFKKDEGTSPTKDCECGDRKTPVRPKDVPCDIHEVTAKGQNLIILVGKMNDRPYEMFVDDNTKGKVDVGKHTKGFLRKVKKSTYDLIVKNAKGEEEVLWEDISRSLKSETYGTLSRFLSMSLRHNVPLQFIVEQLTKDKTFVSFEFGVSKVLKKYIKDGERAIGRFCPECHTEMIFAQGCKMCPQCSFSICS